MTTVTVNPTYPIPNKQLQLVFSLTAPTANFVRVWATIAPTGSTLDKRIDDVKDPRNRVEIYSGNGGTDFPLVTTLDKGGKYTLIAQEYLKGSGYGGGYQGDPAGSDSETKVGSETTLTIFVGQKVTQPIGPAQDRATLNLWVWDSTIRATYKSIHGDDTPSITATPASDKVKSAIESSSVISALSALVNQSVSASIGTLSSLVSNYCTKWNAHISNATYHIDADAADDLAASFYYAYAPNDLHEFVNRAIQLMKYHMTDDSSLDQVAFGPNSGNYHSASDRANMPLYRTTGKLDEAYGAFADLHRCFEAHRTSSGIHPSNDTTNSLSSLPRLMQVHSAYLAVIASSNPTPPAAQSTGVQLLVSGAGFKEV